MFSLEKRYLDEIIAHARAEMPLECCGVLAGTESEVLKLYRTTNSEKSPVRYSVKAEELLQIYRELEKKDWQLLAVYHSHPHGEAYPSLTDLSLARYPDVLHFIISLSEDVPVIRAFWLSPGRVKEETLYID